MKELTLTGTTLPTRGAEFAECVEVPFLGGYIPTVVIDDDPHVILKPIADTLGIHWSSQRAKLAAAKWAIMAVVTTQLPGDDRSRQVIAVSLETFTVWLAGIQEGRVAPEAKEAVVRYKVEAGRVLREHFFGKPGKPSSGLMLPDIANLDPQTLVYLGQIGQALATTSQALIAERAVTAQQMKALEAASEKVAVFDDWLDPDNAVETTDFAKRIGLRSAQQLNGHLRDLGIMRRDLHPRTKKPRNLPTADWGHCFKVVPTRIPTGGFVDVAWILPEGQLEIVEELRNNGLIDI